MPFARDHLLLTIHWRPRDFPNESAQVGLRFYVPGVNPAQVIVDGLKTAVTTFWTTVSAKIPSNQQLTFLRLAKIATNGHYATGTISYDSVFTSPVLGATSPVNPDQIAAATTLTTSVPKGQASKGRIFLPGLAASGAGNYWSGADIDNRSTAVATLVSSLAASLGGPCVIASQGTVRGGGPLLRKVTGCYTGARPDVQRRRVKSIPELPGTNKAITIPAAGDPGEVFTGGGAG